MQLVAGIVRENQSKTPIHSTRYLREKKTKFIIETIHMYTKYTKKFLQALSKPKIVFTRIWHRKTKLSNNGLQQTGVCVYF